MNTLTPLGPTASLLRGAEILGRIRQAFAEKGFDGASMQDLARAAGMSVGNFYRYFPSKDAIVQAMVEHDMAEMQGNFAAIRTSASPLQALRERIAEHIQDKCADDGRLWAEITAAAIRKPEIARVCCGMEDMVADNILAIISSHSGMSHAACVQRFGAQARFIVMLVKATATRNSLMPDPDLRGLILRTIDATLTEITHAAKKE